jgi:hypothetical protein
MAKSKMKQLALAVGIALGGSMSLMPSAQAVNLATDGLGQVLVFPYYSVRDNWQTLIHVVNTSDYVVATKVRFHEAYNSRDVFDFTLILSPHDVWTAVVEDMSAAGAGATDGDTTNRPSIRTTDNSCTVPRIPITATPGVGLPFDGVRVEGGVTVRTAGKTSYTAGAADGGPTNADRMREGYMKIIMTGASLPTGLAANAIHTASGTPANCGALEAAFSNTTGIAALRAAFPLYNETINPLKGSYNLLKTLEGLQVSGSPATLADFYRTTILPVTGDYQLPSGAVGVPGIGDLGPNYLMTLQLPPQRITPIAFSSSYHEPNLNAANTSGEVLPAAGSPVLTSAPDNGPDAVNFLFSRNSVINQWANTTTPSWLVASDWVITHPTKRYYVDTATHEYAGRATGRPGLNPSVPFPFFSNVFAGGASCEPVDLKIYDREERTPGTGPVFSPTPVVGNVLCREVNVITFNGSNILGSSPSITSNIPEAALPGGFGWMQLDFSAGDRAVMGFSATTRNTGSNNLLNNAFLVDHSYLRF